MVVVGLRVGGQHQDINRLGDVSRQKVSAEPFFLGELGPLHAREVEGTLVKCPSLLVSIEIQKSWRAESSGSRSENKLWAMSCEFHRPNIIHSSLAKFSDEVAVSIGMKPMLLRHDHPLRIPFHGFIEHKATRCSIQRSARSQQSVCPLDDAFYQKRLFVPELGKRPGAQCARNAAVNADFVLETHTHNKACCSLRGCDLR